MKYINPKLDCTHYRPLTTVCSCILNVHCGLYIHTNYTLHTHHHTHCTASGQLWGLYVPLTAGK